jgi:hypothetical protein
VKGVMHVSRSWPGRGHPFEDECPCPQEPCGYVSMDQIDPSCPQHSMQAAKTFRAGHDADKCPGGPWRGLA